MRRLKEDNEEVWAGIFGLGVVAFPSCRRTDSRGRFTVMSLLWSPNCLA